MKLIAVALLSSILSALLVFLVIKEKLSGPPSVLPGVLTVKEVQIVDDAGAVRMTLGTHGRWSTPGSPVIELRQVGLSVPGAELDLDRDGKGELWFSGDGVMQRVVVGHFLSGDVVPPSQSDHSWGLRVLNMHPVKGAPDTLYFGATEGGNVGVSGISIKQGLPPDAKPVRAHAP